MTTKRKMPGDHTVGRPPVKGKHVRLILETFILSIGVTIRMIMPLILITIGSIIVWLFLGIFTLGYSNYISTPVTMAFISLYGIRVALELKGNRALVDFRLLATYSVAFGIVLEIVEKIALFIAGKIAVVAARWQTGFPNAISDLQSAEESLAFAFGISAFSFYALFSLFAFVTVQVLFAVPMATAAQNAGKDSKNNSLFDGIGSSFLSLFPIFTISFFLQFFFNLYLFIMLFFGAFLLSLTQLINNLAEMYGSEERLGLDLFSDVDPAAVAISIASVLGLIWLQALVWSGAALALRKHQGQTTKAAKLRRQEAQTPQIDIRALRKSREQRGN